MRLLFARAVLFAAGFLLWALSSTLPMFDRIREGWDGAAYWQIGAPSVLVIVLAVSGERAWRTPLWILFGHLCAMVLIHPSGTDLGLLPLTLVFIGLLAYAVLFVVALVGRTLSARLG
jgi:hypothetical protein